MIIICNHRSSAYHLIQFVYTYDYFAFVITKPLFIQPQSKTLERIIPEVSRLIIADIHCRSLIYNCSLRVRVSNTMLHVRTVSIIRNSTRHIIIRNMFIRKHFFFFFTLDLIIFEETNCLFFSSPTPILVVEDTGVTRVYSLWYSIKLHGFFPHDRLGTITLFHRHPRVCRPDTSKIIPGVTYFRVLKGILTLPLIRVRTYYRTLTVGFGRLCRALILHCRLRVPDNIFSRSQ